MKIGSVLDFQSVCRLSGREPYWMLPLTTFAPLRTTFAPILTRYEHVGPTSVCTHYKYAKFGQISRYTVESRSVGNFHVENKTGDQTIVRYTCIALHGQQKDESLLYICLAASTASGSSTNYSTTRGVR